MEGGNASRAVIERLRKALGCSFLICLIQLLLATLLRVVLCIGHSGIGMLQIDLVQSMLPAHLHNRILQEIQIGF